MRTNSQKTRIFPLKNAHKKIDGATLDSINDAKSNNISWLNPHQIGVGKSFFGKGSKII
jgi:hypothetical protein